MAVPLKKFFVPAKKEAENRQFTQPSNIPGEKPAEYQNGNINTTTFQQSVLCLKLDPKRDKLLQDVLYSMESLMGKSGCWSLTEDIWPNSDDRKNHEAGSPKLIASSEVVNVDQLLQILSESFDVDKDMLQAQREDVAKNRKAAEFILNLTVVEADVQCVKKDAKKTDYYIKITSGPKFKEEFVTPQIKGTRPRWNHNVQLKLSDIFSDYVRIELCRGTIEEKTKRKIFMQKFRKQQEGKSDFLLADLTRPLKGISSHSISGWYEMENQSGTKTTEVTRVNLAGNISCIGEVELKTPDAYESLLCHLVGRYIDGETPPASEKIQPCGDPGNSLKLPVGIKALLSQHATVLNLSYPTRLLAWWSNVTVAEYPVDWELILLQFIEVKGYLFQEIYSIEEQKHLQGTLSKLLDQCMWCIKNLEACFPVASKEQSMTQITSMLQILKSIEDIPRMISSLEEKVLSVRDIFISDLQRFFRARCYEILNILNRSSEMKDQLEAAVTITDEVNNLLRQMVDFYDCIFASESEVCGLKSTYPVIAEQTLNTIRPVIEYCCQSIPDMEDYDETFVSYPPLPKCGVEYDLLKGSSLMRIYKNIIKMLSLRCPHMTQVMGINDGLHQYNDYFKDGIKNQLSLTSYREVHLLKHIVFEDELTVVGPQTPLSASLLEATAIPHRMKVWWGEFVWVNSEDSFFYFDRMLKHLLFHSTTYCKLVEERIDFALKQNDKKSEQFINAKVCVVIRNMNTMAKEMDRIPDILGYKFNQEGQREVKTQHDEEVKTLVQEAIQGVRSILRDFISEVLKKRREFLLQAIVSSCQKRLGSSFLSNVLHPTFDLLRKHLEINNIQQFLKGFWETIVNVMRNMITEKSLRNPEFYGKLHRLLKEIFTDLTPESKEVLDVQSAESDEYRSLVEDLRLIEKTSSSLINLYYRERCQEGISESTVSTTTLDISTFFKKKDRLVVHVLMAKDIVLPPEEAPGLTWPCYVEIQILSPHNNTGVKSTSVENNDPATYDEEFELELKKPKEAVREGFLLLTLKRYNMIGSNSFLGEAFVFLGDINPSDQNPKYFHLKIMKHFDTGCLKILDILQRRKQDENACSFLKELSETHPSVNNISNSVALIPEVPLPCTFPCS